MSSKIVTDAGGFFIAGRYNEQFTFSLDKSVKMGEVVYYNGKLVGLAVNGLEVDEYDAAAGEALPTAVLTSGTVIEERITATDEEKLKLNAMGIHFRDGDFEAVKTPGAGE